ncbi:Tctex1 domain containing-protein 1 [Paragonimus heterotremus]|uniref:Tctex1 domain containing-protein 1 n=1 Tax=Paragonimus heterotremus TaxID=100268 RepID=A0A8J4SPG9_9TREM|nr:Tctex1 domain containing-protein 1 [Paragonimus heterotremus]
MENISANTVPNIDAAPNVDKQNSYVIRPQFDQKFRPSVVKAILNRILKDRLENEKYSAEESHNNCISIADEIKQTLKKTLTLSRYRYLVQVIIGEQRGQGVKVAYRCYWDSDTDNYAEASFMNDSIFCVASAFGVYSY